MTKEQLIEFNRMFTARFSKRLVELNKNVYLSAEKDGAVFEVPVITLGKGGGTIIEPRLANPKLNLPARVSLISQDVDAFQIVYNMEIPQEEAAIAAEKPEYFNYLMDTVFEKALGNYRLTVGDEHKVRFGSYYLQVPEMQLTAEHSVLLTFRGKWANVEGVGAGQ